MQDTGLVECGKPPVAPNPRTWKGQPSLPTPTPEPPRHDAPCPDAPPPPSDGECPPYDDFDDAIASW